MFETPIQSSFVSQVAPIGFADAAGAADDLTGLSVTAGRTRLEVQERVGNGWAGAIWYSGVLYTGSVLIPAVKVDVVLSPWSAGRTEVGIRPLGRLGRLDSARARRFFDAAWSVLPPLVDRLSVTEPVSVPVDAGLKVAA
jgi:hypothetical protein